MFNRNRAMASAWVAPLASVLVPAEDKDFPADRADPVSPARLEPPVLVTLPVARRRQDRAGSVGRVVSAGARVAVGEDGVGDSVAAEAAVAVARNAPMATPSSATG